MSSTVSSNSIRGSERALSRVIMRRVGMSRGNGANYFKGDGAYKRALPVNESLGRGEGNSYTFWRTQAALLPQYSTAIKMSRQPL